VARAAFAALAFFIAKTWLAAFAALAFFYCIARAALCRLIFVYIQLDRRARVGRRKRGGSCASRDPHER